MSSSWGLSEATQIDSLFSTTSNSQTQLDSLANSALSRGIDRYTGKDYAGAAMEFKRAIGFAPFSDNSPKAYEYLSQAYLKMGKTDDAIKTTKAAVKTFPIDDTFRLSLGDLYFKRGQYGEAIEAYTEAVRLNPHSADNRFSLGLAYLSDGRLKEAENQFIEVSRLTPNSPVGVFGRGQVLRSLGQYNEALEQLNKAVKLDNGFANAYLEMGYTYIDMGDMDQAQNQLTILQRLGAASQSMELEAYMLQSADPKIILAYSPNSFAFYSGPGTHVSALDSTLSAGNATKEYKMSFTFSKDMDIDSVESLSNWQMEKQRGEYYLENYNYGNSIPSTEVSFPTGPSKVIYDPTVRTALLYFSISQNSTGDGTIDPAHMLFRFTGKDAYGKNMDPNADEYSGFSLIA
ncbi:MAG: tetratricopeptide repeat protein [Deltaproteobacteria bacterium]|nr:tetratricopeptide repeat protein [Deltaproteobacteria bacterium]